MTRARALLVPSVTWLVALASSPVMASSATPLSKVIEMLDGMLVTCKEEKNSEETEFAAKQQWCDSTRASTEKSIAEATAQIEQLTADILKAEADAEELGAAAEEALSEADSLQVEADNATAIRKQEKSDYTATHADFTESIDAVERAVAVLKGRSADIPQSLLQLKRLHHIPFEAQQSIEALLSTKQAPEANAYEFQSGGAVAMLEKLRLKFQDERLALEKAELAAKSNYEVLLQRLTDNIKTLKATASKKTAVKAQRLEDAAAAKGDLKVTEAAKAEDEKTLSDTLAECSAASKEFEANQVVRSEEIKAIETAVGILSSDNVSGNAETYLPSASFIQKASVSLAQLRGVAADVLPKGRQRAAELLESRAKELGSRYLSLAASRVSADPFAKVKKMVKDLIVKLMEEANSEADHNAYCTTELATNKQTREIKSAEVEELTATVEKLTAKSERLASELAELGDAVAEINKQQSEATTLRQEEKATNAKTMADAKESQVAVERAIQVLKEFYAKNSDASLLQVGAELADKSSHAAKAPYKGMQTMNGNVMGFLEVVLSDFARLEADTSSSEDQAQQSYEKYMDESAEDKAVKETEISHKKDVKMDTDASITSTGKELELTHEELDAALNYYEKLKPDCVNVGLSYEERVEKREAEIQSLQEALKMLSQENLD